MIELTAKGVETSIHNPEKAKNIKVYAGIITGLCKIQNKDKKIVVKKINLH